VSSKGRYALAWEIWRRQVSVVGTVQTVSKGLGFGSNFSSVFLR
jgi:hypothetical protein